MLNEDNIKLIFGLKLKHLRGKKGLSASQLATNSNVSASYLNEIEKGKKYPKADKIAAICKALDVKYDDLVSLKMPKELSAIGTLIQSNIINELPLNILGIDSTGLIELLSNSPTKINAFINTVVEIARNYDMQTEYFFYSVLRTYQELQENYFEEIEKSVITFRNKFDLLNNHLLSVDKLKELLTKNFGYHFEYLPINENNALQSVRSVYNQSSNILYINKTLNTHQNLFILGRELAFNYLKIENRPVATTVLRNPSFELILNNFKASYFATALLLPEHKMIKDLTKFFNQNTWDVKSFENMIASCGVSAEMYMHRLTNILPKHFRLKSIFFLRLANREETERYDITKELHLSRLHNPHANGTNRHYCRRWISIKVLQNLKQTNAGQLSEETLIDAQRSHYVGTNNSYFIFSIARPMYPISGTNTSVSIGILMDENFKKTVSFWDDDTVKDEEVNQTCEICPLTDCKERAIAPYILNKKKREAAVDKALLELASSKDLEVTS